jgi:hypothetical protein
VGKAPGCVCSAPTCIVNEISTELRIYFLDTTTQANLCMHQIGLSIDSQNPMAGWACVTS